MKVIKKITIFIFVVISFLILGILYDLSSFDSSYINRNSITFNKNNLNSKKVKKIFNEIEEYYYILGYKLLDSHKEFWKIENPLERENLPKKILISAKNENFLPGTKIENIEKNYSNWTRSHGGYSSMRFSNLNKINKTNIKKLKVAWIYKSNDAKKCIHANPVENDGLVYFPTPGNLIVCLDGATGKIVWKYKVKRGFWAAKRGLLLWKDKKNKKLKIFFTNDDQLIALNAKTGIPLKEFGKKGIIKIGSTPTPAIIIDEQLVIASTRPAIEVYDVYTGKLKWKYYLRKINKELVYNAT